MDVQQIIAIGLVIMAAFSLGRRYTRKRWSRLKKNCDNCACGPGTKGIRPD